VKEVSSHIIFYYGKCSIPKPFAITGAELDEHFGWPVLEAIEEVNVYFHDYFRFCQARARACAVNPAAWR
jgi:hypothetical protein